MQGHVSAWIRFAELIYAAVASIAMYINICTSETSGPGGGDGRGVVVVVGGIHCEEGKSSRLHVQSAENEARYVLVVFRIRYAEK